MSLEIQKDSIIWSIKSLSKHGDGDLFPKPKEFEALSQHADKLADALTASDFTQIHPGPCRRFLVPKEMADFKQATQLDIQDSIILNAIIYEYGNLIERRRQPISLNRVFSYRFNPNSDGELYPNKNAWNNFWNAVVQKSEQFSHCLLFDIADFYNQIYHHTVANQLIESGFKNIHKKWIMELLEKSTAKVSRGVPIGPHASHILAEMSLIPFDKSLELKGLEFCRYADDIVIFYNSESDMLGIIYDVVETLDKQQKLILQKYKTKQLSKLEIQALANKMLEDRPISSKEKEFLKIIKKYSGGDPYVTITYEEISPDDFRFIKNESIQSIVTEYLESKPTDYIRLRWFLRRVSQIGSGAVLEICLDNIDKLLPCIASLCSYMGSIKTVEEKDWPRIGDKIIGFLNNEIVRNREYFQMMIVSIFNRVYSIDRFDRLIRVYQQSPSSAKREIILSAINNSAGEWIREQKENFQTMDQWQRYALILASHLLPKEERVFFLRSIKTNNIVEKILIHYSNRF